MAKKEVDEDIEELELDDEETEVEMLEFALNDEEIDELIEKLQNLKKSKKNVFFEIDEKNELMIHHEDEE